MLAKLAIEAGLPPGVLGIIHGTHDCVNFICDAPEIKYVHTPTHSTRTGYSILLCVHLCPPSIPCNNQSFFIASLLSTWS